MWSWGYNNFGTLGDGSTTTRSSPTQLPGTTWDTVTVGWKSVASVKTDGTMWGWGHNQAGNLGDNSDTQRSSPVQVGTDTTWKDVQVLNYYNAFATKTNGTLWTWGQNNGGQLGHNNEIQYSSPTQVGTDTTWSQIGGQIHAIKTDGTLWWWGDNAYGLAGTNNSGNPNNKSSPVQVGTDTDWKAVTNMGSNILFNRSLS